MLGRLASIMLFSAMVCHGAEVLAHGGCACAPRCVPQVQCVEKTIYVPQVTMEKRTVLCTVCEPQTQQRTYTAYRCIPETRQVTRMVKIWEPQVRKSTVTEVVRIPETHWAEREFTVQEQVWKNVERECQVEVCYWEDQQVERTVLVPYDEIHQGVRQVWRRIPVKETRTVCHDEGQWEEREMTGCARQCGRCAKCRQQCTVKCKVWVPKIVEKQVEVTAHKCQLVDETYEYAVTVCKPETKTETVKVCRTKLEPRTVTERVCAYETRVETRKVPICHYRTEQREHDVVYTVCVPRMVERVFHETSYKHVAEQRTETCVVMVPKQVEREILVPVCHMVPKTIQVPVCLGCGIVCH